MSYFSEKLNDAKGRYSNYDRELYAVVQSLKFWRHYLLHQEFTLFSDHDALRFLHSQKKLSAWHGRWAEFLQDFTFSLRHRPGRDNRVADALNRRHHTLQISQAAITGFDQLPLLYADCPDFQEAWRSATQSTITSNEYREESGFLFFHNRLCIPTGSTRDFLIWELHGGGGGGTCGSLRHRKDPPCRRRSLLLATAPSRRSTPGRPMFYLHHRQADEINSGALSTVIDSGIPLARCQFRLRPGPTSYSAATRFDPSGHRPF